MWIYKQRQLHYTWLCVMGVNSSILSGGNLCAVMWWVCMYPYFREEIVHVVGVVKPIAFQESIKKAFQESINFSDAVCCGCDYTPTTYSIWESDSHHGQFSRLWWKKYRCGHNYIWEKYRCGHNYIWEKYRCGHNYIWEKYRCGHTHNYIYEKSIGVGTITYEKSIGVGTITYEKSIGVGTITYEKSIGVGTITYEKSIGVGTPTITYMRKV